MSTPRQGCSSADRINVSLFTVVGGTRVFDFGTFAHHVVVDRDQVIQTPDHVDDIHAAAWPLGAVTAWRYIYHHASLDAERQLLTI